MPWSEEISRVTLRNLTCHLEKYHLTSWENSSVVLRSHVVWAAKSCSSKVPAMQITGVELSARKEERKLLDEVNLLHFSKTFYICFSRKMHFYNTKKRQYSFDILKSFFRTTLVTGVVQEGETGRAMTPPIYSQNNAMLCVRKSWCSFGVPPSPLSKSMRGSSVRVQSVG